MSHLAWLVLAVGVLAVVAVIAVASFQKHSLFHNDTRAVAMATEGGVDVQTTIALRPKRGGYDVVATVTIENTTGDPVPYMGAACHNPVTVDFTSTIPAPGSPRDSPPTAALRAHVMDYRRSLDGALTFMDDPAGQRWPDHACDEAGPPLLPVREKVVYTMSSPLVAGGVTFVDGPTTDVVTRLRLATL